MTEEIETKSGVEGRAGAEEAARTLPEHPVRLALLDVLAETGTLTATEAAARLGLSSGLCSFHLRRLAEHGLVEEAPRGGRGGGRAKPWRLRWGPVPPSGGAPEERPQAVDWPATYRRDCPSRTVVELLADKWVLYALAALRRSERPLRFNELRRLLDGITQKMLAQTLRSLERDGLVRRTVYPTVPPSVEYALTELGLEAGKLTAAIGAWSVRHAPAVHAARAAYDTRAAAPPKPLD
ncbi:winged helix-turn-helix transcriptional regulator [Kitasatospora sp. NPDC001540]|uniref:winged helix-turn-helix transcriptional regulator n=1 Tax=Kitasatospora sp. NPDC001540 TaxID=3364014 RepID=UPI0036A826CD